MTLIQLKYFNTVCRLHSITQAANELFVTQPTVSLAIKELEEELNLTLLIREGNKLTLTEEGRILYTKSTSIIKRCNDLVLEMAELNKSHKQLKIGIPPMLSMVFFPELADEFTVNHKNISIMLDEAGSAKACKLVCEEKLDMAIVNMGMNDTEKLESKILIKDQLVFCVSKDHPFADREKLTIKDFDKQEIILFNSDSVQNLLFKTKFETQGVFPHIIMQGSQLYTILNFIRGGKRGCFMFECIANNFDDVVNIPLDPPFKIDAGLIWKKDRYLSNDVQEFISFVENKFQN